MPFSLRRPVMRSAFAPADRRALPLLALAIAIASACGGGEDGPAEPAEAEPAPAPAAEPTGASPAEGGGAPEGQAATVAAEPPAPADACERAQACCPAYVAALPASGRTEAGEACSTLSLAAQLEGQARDEACQGALEGFRSSLRATGLEVPSACQ